jgi:protein tyrosine/serine phosphatase
VIEPPPSPTEPGGSGVVPNGSTGPRPAGALNFRDVGGIPAGPGRRVRTGLLYRSDTLQFLTEDDVVLLVETLGLRTEVDLRRPEELTTEGRGRLTTSPVVHRHLPFMVGAKVDGSAVPVLGEHDPVVEHYLGYLDHSPTTVAGAVRALAEPEALPAVVHCAAGKDRTGVTVALVLSVAGASDDDIAAEYAAEPENILRVVERLRGLPSYGPAIDKQPPEAHLTPPEYMLRFLAELGRRYGGARGWLLRHGLTDDELDGLRDRLTEPAPAGA